MIRLSPPVYFRRIGDPPIMRICLNESRIFEFWALLIWYGFGALYLNKQCLNNNTYVQSKAEYALISEPQSRACANAQERLGVRAYSAYRSGKRRDEKERRTLVRRFTTFRLKLTSGHKSAALVLDSHRILHALPKITLDCERTIF